MSVPSLFQSEVDQVDPTKTLVTVTDASYADDEWSYSGLTVTAGSDIGLEMGLSELLYAMGFRHWGPAAYHEEFIYRPASINTGLTQAKTRFWLPDISVSLTYGHSFVNDSTSRVALNDAYADWQTLNNADLSRWPGGHRWSSIISANQAFFDANADLRMETSSGSGTYTFDLSVTGDRYDTLVEIAAAQVLSDGLNSYGRTNFDPTDGDQQDTDTVCQFAIDVCKRVRSGTDAVGTHPARAGVANATLGILAYGGHRFPPSIDLRPYLYVQVALGFSSAGLGYPGLVDQWGAKSVAVGLREYFDVMQWSYSNPFGGRKQANYYDWYDDFVSSGVTSVVGEFNANWLVNMLSMHHGIRKMKTGAGTLQDVIDDFVTKKLSGNAAASALYTYWASDSESYNKFSLRRSTDLVDDLPDGWLRDKNRHLMLILDRYRRLPSQSDDSFETAFTDLFKAIHGVRQLDITHAYAWERRLANANVSSSHPDLWMFKSPPPNWDTLAAEPTESDYTAMVAALRADTDRDIALYSEDYVVVDVTPAVTATTAAQCFYQVSTTASYIFAGPGSVTVSDSTGQTQETRSYGAGLYKFTEDGSVYVFAASGLLFMNLFYGVRKDPDSSISSVIDGAVGGRNHWMYFPRSVKGRVDLLSSARIRVVHSGGTCDVGAGGDPNTIVPGMNKIDNTNTRGTHYPANINPWLSCSPYKMLMSRELARKEFPASIFLGVA